MENKFLDNLLQTLEVDLPQRESLDEFLELIIPEIRKWGEDLYETEYYSQQGGKPWLEFRDEDNFHNTVLHFFNEGSEYLKSTDGNVIRGKWRLLENTNKMIIESGNNTELFELAFLNSTFFIFFKHGEQQRRRKYLVLGYEPATSGLEWLDYVELLFNIVRANNRKVQVTTAAIIIVILIVLLLSVF